MAAFGNNGINVGWLASFAVEVNTFKAARISLCHWRSKFSVSYTQNMDSHAARQVSIELPNTMPPEMGRKLALTRDAPRTWTYLGKWPAGQLSSLVS